MLCDAGASWWSSPVPCGRAKARFPLPELTGDRFLLTVNTGCIDGHAFPLAELTGLLSVWPSYLVISVHNTKKQQSDLLTVTHAACMSKQLQFLLSVT